MRLIFLCLCLTLVHLISLYVYGGVYYFGVSWTRWFWSLAVLAVIALGAMCRRSLTARGALAAAIIGLPVALASKPLFATLLSFLILGSLVTHVGADIKTKSDGEFRQGGGRGAVQVFANGWLVSHAALIALLGGWTLPFAETLGVLYLAACCGDTFASEIGPAIARNSPRLVLKPWQVVPTGTNGGVTLEGTVISAVGGLAVFLAYHFAGGTSSLLNWKSAVAAALIGSLVDSVLGQTMQASYVTEKGLVNDKIGHHISGLDILTGSTINLVSSCIAVFTVLYVVL